MNILLERVNNVCEDVRARCSGTTSFKKLIAQTRKTFKQYNFDLVIKTKREKMLDVDNFYVMAYYDSHDDSHGDTPIEVYVHHNLNGNELFGEHQTTSFLIEIYDAVVHEYRHQHQSVRRNHKEYQSHARHLTEQYWSNVDEVDAYAVSKAVEILRHMSKERARIYMGRISVMSKMRKGPYYAIPMLNTYISQFGNRPIIRNLSKKVYKHLETIDKQFVFK